MIVVTPAVLDAAVRPPATQVASTVKPGVGVCAKRIGNEFFKGQVGTVQIAPGNAITADVQLSRHTQRRGPQISIQYINPAIADRSTNRNARPVDPLDLPGGGKGGRFGGSIAIEQVTGRAICQDPGNHHGVEHIAADDQITQPGKCIAQARCILVKQASRHPQHTHRLLQQQPGEMRPRQQNVLIHQDHATAIEQRGPDFQRTGVERRVGGKRYAVCGIEVGVTVIDDQATDCPVCHQHTLWRSGGARGVHDVSRRTTDQRLLRYGFSLSVQIQGIEIQTRNTGQWRTTAHTQQYTGLAVLKDELQTFGRCIDVQRHIDRAALENRQLADQQLE
ncbi:hypothetical protein PSCICO_03090 [Pseudomonas cichorii]|nr:hypothetical protein PSCICO_03090 [Pseudomonas cichorii]